MYKKTIDGADYYFINYRKERRMKKLRKVLAFIGISYFLWAFKAPEFISTFL